MDAEAKLKVSIETSATGQGVQQTAAGLEKLSGAAQKAAPAVGAVANQSKATAQELGRGVEVGNAAVSAFQNIANAGQGGASGLIAVARAGFSAGAMFKGLLASMGPVGIAAAGIGIALGLVSAALRKSEESAAAAKKKIDELNQAKLDEAVKQQEALKRAAEDTLRTLQAEAAAREQIGEAELGKRKAETIAAGKAAGEDPILTQQKLTALDRQWEDEKRANALKLANAEAKAKADAQQKLEASAKTAADNLAAAQARRAEVEAAEKAKQAAKAALDAESARNVGMPAGAAKAIDPKIAEAYGAASARAAEAAKAAVEDTEEKIAGLKAQLADKTKEAEAAARAAEQARADANRLADTQTVIAPKIAAQRIAEDAAKRDKTPAQEAAEKQAQEAEDARIRRTTAAVWNNRMAMKDGVDDATAAAVLRNYPGYKFVDRPKSAAQSAPLTPTGSVADLAAKTAAEAAARAAAAKPSGGTIIGPDGRPIAVQSGQPTGPGRGAYREEGQGGKSITQPLKDAAEAMKSAPTGDDTAKAAEELKKAAESATQAQKAATDQTVAALTDLVSLNQGVVDTLTPIPPQIASIRSEIQKLWGAVRSASRKSNTA
jgi:hypothetical protein